MRTESPPSVLHSMQLLTQRANLQGRTSRRRRGFRGCGLRRFQHASSDRRIGVDIPAALPYVTGVGGTSFSGRSTATVDPNNPSCYLATPLGGFLQCDQRGSALKYIPEVT